MLSPLADYFIACFSSVRTGNQREKVFAFYKIYVIGIGSSDLLWRDHTVIKSIEEGSNDIMIKLYEKGIKPAEN